MNFSRMNYRHILSLAFVLVILPLCAYAQGWTPAETDRKNSATVASSYLKALSENRMEDAYAFLSPALQKMMPFKEWKKFQQLQNDSLGTNPQYKDMQAQWAENPPQTPPGIYVAYKLNASFTKIKSCDELVVMQRQDNGGYLIMRHERTVLDAKPDTALIKKLEKIDGIESSTRATAKTSVADMLKELRSRKDVKIEEKEGWTIATAPKDNTQWSFTPATHPAHPAYAKRWPDKENGKAVMKMEITCEATKEACNLFAADFESLSRQTLKKSAD